MNKVVTIPVYMLNEEAQQFLEFQKNYAFFSLLIEKKVHEQRGAAITLNIDNKGIIGSITRNDVLYLSTVKFDNVNPK